MPQGIERSNLGKVFWPAPGLTKGDLLAYADAAAPFLLPALRNRPLTVKRYPDGIEGMTFFQKNTPAYAPDWVETITLRAESAKRDVAYALCNTKRTLMWLVNQAVIEFHPWLSRADRLERPDFLVLDIDPPEGAFDAAVKGALLIRGVMEEAGLRPVAKTSGAKGVHVYVPIQRRYGYDVVRRAAVTLAERACEREPDLVTPEIRKDKRNGRVFLDSGRVGAGAHIVAVYSPRARPAASVSYPVPWDDLPKVKAEDFTIPNVPDLLREKGDLWKELLGRPQRIPDELLG
jgi:bifunctional non-homologous end joining protein LigD